MDGDQCSVRGIFSDEANNELDNYMHSKKVYVNLKGELSKTPSNEFIQCIYNFTLVLPDTKLSDPKF